MYAVGAKLHKTLDEMADMSTEELCGWMEFFSWRAEEEKKATDKARKSARR